MKLLPGCICVVADDANVWSRHFVECNIAGAARVIMTVHDNDVILLLAVVSRKVHEEIVDDCLCLVMGQTGWISPQYLTVFHP